jgi:glycosyltransferase involved in cell wall biosynthesis
MQNKLNKKKDLEDILSLQKQIELNKSDLLAKDIMINNLLNSTSFKITMPLRILKKLFFSIPQNFFQNVFLFLRSDLSELRVISILDRLEDIERRQEIRLRWKLSQHALLLLKCFLNLYLHILKLYPKVFLSNFRYWRYINYEKKEYTRQAHEINRHINLQIVKPKFSIIIHIKNELQHLSLTLLSLQKQVYVRFNIKIIINNVNLNTIEKFLQKFDKDFVDKIEIIEKFIPNKVDTEYFIFMKPGQSLSLFALYEFSNSINLQPSDLIYADEDMLNVFGIRSNPFFKPDWSPDFLESFNYINFPASISKALVIKHYTNGNLYDLFLRATEHTKTIKHIKKILGHSRAFLFKSIFYKNKYEDIIALKARLERTGRKGEVLVNKALSGSYFIKLTRETSPLVSIVIPTAGRVVNIKNRKLDLILNLLDQIYSKSTYKNFEVIIVDNGDLSKEQLKKISSYKCQRVSFKEKIFKI